MNKNVKQAHDAWRDAEKALFALQDEYNTKVDALKAQYGPRLENAGDETHRLQKEFCDLDAAQAIADRDGLDDDGKQALAESLGLTLPDA